MQEFVNEVINGVRERLSDCEVRVGIKDMPNGLTKTGIVIKPNGTNIAPTIYVDDFYKNDLSAKDTIDTIVRIYHDHKIPSIDMEWYSDFEQVRPQLRARLYNKSTKAEVFRSAEEYGFDDLIIVPYVNVNMGPNEGGSIKVTSEHCKQWEISVDEVIDIALENVARLSKVQDMADFMSKSTGMPREMFGENSFMSIINLTENNGQYGAISAITCRSQLKEMYPDGYCVIPASIHECIIVPMIDGFGDLTEMVKTVNATEVAPEEILSDHVYKVAG